MTTEPAAMPAIPEADALADRNWFANHQDRLFRARSCEAGMIRLIRRRRCGADFDVLLSTFSKVAIPEDADHLIAPVWFASAYPDWSAERVLKQARKALKRGKR